MRYGHPLLSVSAALSRAIDRDLPDIFEEWRGKRLRRRPDSADLDVQLWQQSFPNTALMFETGIAGQALGRADVVVVSNSMVAAVYCNGDLAYFANMNHENFQERVRTQNLPNQREARAMPWFLGVKTREEPLETDK